MLCSLAKGLDENSINAITSLENEIGTTLLAFSCSDINPAKITPEQAEKIKQLEEKLGLNLVAVKV